MPRAATSRIFLPCASSEAFDNSARRIAGHLYSKALTVRFAASMLAAVITIKRIAAFMTPYATRIESRALVQFAPQQIGFLGMIRLTLA